MKMAMSSRYGRYAHTYTEPISAIAAAVGFRDICHFTRIFREKTGQIPSAYRNRQ